ncbi:hypothetical protein [Ruminococcus callidus]|uniref:hypothetical protein n=1 Tax=Ruminococcus callidus TaxID=40519 RepID=UPI0023F7B4CA|nr:hypothetical protein [Ruminococcus callidus]
MASMEELYNTIADIWDSYDIYRQEHADKYGEAEESPSTIEQIKRHFYYVEKNKAGGLIPKIKNKINLDLELKETDSPEEKSDKLWLLEQIYVAEKIGVYRYSAKNTELPEREFWILSQTRKGCMCTIIMMITTMKLWMHLKRYTRMSKRL